jgi:hypothetical protein
MHLVGFVRVAFSLCEPCTLVYATQRYSIVRTAAAITGVSRFGKKLHSSPGVGGFCQVRNVGNALQRKLDTISSCGPRGLKLGPILGDRIGSCVYWSLVPGMSSHFVFELRPCSQSEVRDEVAL